MHAPRLHVIYEDNHLLAIAKPAGLATMGLRDDRPTLLTLAKEYVKERYLKPGNVYLGVVSRLDAPVTGLVLFARTSKAARRLTEQFRSRTVQKVYWAIVEGVFSNSGLAGTWEDWLGPDERRRRMRIVGPGMPEAKQARLSYRQLRTLGARDEGSAARGEGRRVRGQGHGFHLPPSGVPLSLVEIRPETGRKHQIRLQLAQRGHPILGDRKYGSRQIFEPGIALHARRLTVIHPVKDEPLTLEAPIPEAWKVFGVVG